MLKMSYYATELSWQCRIFVVYYVNSVEMNPLSLSLSLQNFFIEPIDLVRNDRKGTTDLLYRRVLINKINYQYHTMQLCDNKI